VEDFNKIYFTKYRFLVLSTNSENVRSVAFLATEYNKVLSELSAGSSR